MSFQPSLGPNPVITGSVLRLWRMNSGSEVYGFFFPKSSRTFLSTIFQWITGQKRA